MNKDVFCFCIIGPPACGKTKYINENLKNCQVIRPGEMLKKESEQETLLGRYLKNNWNHESHTPVIINMIQRFLRSVPLNVNIVLDGFPRNIDEVNMLGDISQHRKVCVYDMNVPKEICNSRYLQRRDEEHTPTQSSFDIRWTTYEKQQKIIQQMLMERSIYSTEGIDPRIAKVQIPYKLIIPENYVEPIEVACILQLLVDSVPSERTWKHFPGRHAVTLRKFDTPRLNLGTGWLVSVKIDGIRGFLLPLYENIYFVNRKLDVHYVCKQAIPGFFLYDAEFIDNKYVIIDILYHEGQNLMEKSLEARMNSAETVTLFMSIFLAQQYFRVKYVNEIDLTRFPFKRDGFVFTPNFLSYKSGTDYSLLKWKEQKDNTVDFLYREGLLYVANKTKLEKYAKIQREDWYENDCILECNYVNGHWKGIRIRRDKNKPNPRPIVDSIYQSIKNPLTWQELLNCPIQPPFDETEEYASKYPLSKNKATPLPKIDTYYRNQPNYNVRHQKRVKYTR